MFRRFASPAAKWASFALIGVSGARLAAVAVAPAPNNDKQATRPAPTDAELGKKPGWYKAAVLELEEVIQRLGKYTPIESNDTLEKAHDVLLRIQDQNQVEIYWRLARVLVEKANLSKNAHEQEHLLHEAVDYFQKSFTIEPAKGCAGAHKWYALALGRLATLDKKLTKMVKVDEEVTKHLEKASKIDPKDAFTWYYLGKHHYDKKEYSKATSCFKKAEEVKAGFSPTNLYYLGLSLEQEGDKNAAKEALMKAHNTRTVVIMTDTKAKSYAAAKLLKDYKVPHDEVYPSY